MIPKRIFYVWGVNDPKKRDVLACMQSWRQICPDYEIIEINEESIDYFNFQNELKENKWFKTVYERKMWAYVADYIRVKVLYNHGGIYLDTDVTVLKSFDKFLNDPAFVGMQRNNVELDKDYVEPAILGSKKGNKFIKELIDFYEKGIWEEPIFTMPEIFQKFLQKANCPSFGKKTDQTKIELENIHIYPERFFIPFRYKETYSPKCVESDTHTIHWFGGSWTDPKTIHFLMNKHKKDFDQSTSSINIKEVWRVNLIKILPLLKIIKIDEKISVLLFSFIPILLIKKSQAFLFNIIPFIKIKTKSVAR